MARDPRFRTKLITCAVINALYRDHDIYTYYTLNGRNPLAIVVPCHRVVGSDGSLVGFGGGLERKARLLELEAPQLQLGV